jgi:integrase/recombinase XerD
MNHHLPQLDFATVLQDFFCSYLIDQRNLSHETIASYRDTFRLLLVYLHDTRHLEPTAIGLTDLDASLVLDFLRYLEQDRGNSVRTRNVRLAAIRSFAKYATLREPSVAGAVRSLLAIPLKRTVHPLLGFLSRQEIDAILQAPDPTTWSGCRDRVMFATFYNTGARVAELTSLRVADLDLGRSRSITLHGKGRKQRVIPLWQQTARQLDSWIHDTGASACDPVFPGRRGQQLTRAGVEYRLQWAVSRAAETCPALRERKITPHTIRHTTAMHLLQAGIAPTVIALWLGHESPTTTQLYIEADLAMKEHALATLHEPSEHAARYSPPDRLLAFLQSL